MKKLDAEEGFFNLHLDIIRRIINRSIHPKKQRNFDLKINKKRLTNFK